MKEKMFAFFDAQNTETQGVALPDFMKGKSLCAAAIKTKMEAGQWF